MMFEKLKRWVSCFILCMVLGFAYLPAEARADSPVSIETVEELMAISDNLKGSYILANDLDLTGSLPKNGWKSIGTFKGTFDGNGHTISGLWGEGGCYKGLFSIIDGAKISNLTIILSEQGLTGGYEVGAVAGKAKNAAVIENVTVKGGFIRVTGGGYAGGIVGKFDQRGGKLSNVKVIGTTTETSGNYSGGVLGFGRKITIEGARAESTQSKAFSYAGGIAGALEGCTVSDSHVVFNPKIDNQALNDANAEISAKGSYAGGFAGAIYGKTAVADSSVEGNAIDAGLSYSGGFIGTMYEKSTIERCHTTIKEVQAASEYAGGFAGEINSGSVTLATATGNAKAANVAGGFTAIAYNKAKLLQTSARGNVYSKINYAGGLAGKLHGGSSIEQGCAYGDVQTNGYVSGGLVGEVAGNSTVANAFAQGNVSGTTGVGGLVGYFSGSGKVQKHTVYNCYSTGTVSGKAGSKEVGAFSGHSGVTFMGTNYYNTDYAGTEQIHGTAGHPQGTPPVGKTTLEMLEQATYEGWDFDQIWSIDEGSSYPFFTFN